MANSYLGEPPTLKDLYHSLLKQPEPEARGLALSSELFITGSLNTFAQRTNVDTKARIIAYDIRELGEQLMPIGMLVTLDAIFNRVIQNWKKGKTTWVIADEFYLLFRYQYSAEFFLQAVEADPQVQRPGDRVNTERGGAPPFRHRPA